MTDKIFKSRIYRVFNNLKLENRDSEVSPLIPIYRKNKLLAYFRPLSVSSLNNQEEINSLAIWRQKHNWWFPAQFKVTIEGTKKWVENQVIQNPDRLLFMLEDPSGKIIGHLGLYRFNFSERSCEVDNIIRGEDLIPGVMTEALKTLIVWSTLTLKIKKFYLKVYADNERAIALYKRCGFKKLKKIPMKKIVENEVVSWEENPKMKEKEIERFHLQMFLEKNEKKLSGTSVKD